jgi:hypothetical protein
MSQIRPPEDRLRARATGYRIALAALVIGAAIFGIVLLITLLAR